MTAPSAVGSIVKSSMPKISRSARSCRIAHRELVVASIAGSTTFTVQNFLALNPGLAATFPWLAPQAQQWEQYRCLKLNAEYIPIAPTSTQGDIIISPNYDSSDPQPTTETQAGNSQDSVTLSCWSAVIVPLDPSAMMGLGPRRFVRPSAVAGDIKTFDVGTLAICSNNETGTSAIGKLYLDYDFEFFIPQNDPSTATLPLQTSLFAYASANQTYTTSVAAVQNWNSKIYDPLGIGSGSSGTFTPPAGVYLVYANICANDNGNETFTFKAEIIKNGASLSQPLVSTVRMFAGSSPQLQNVVFGIVPCNGTDTIAVNVTLTGAAGTLIVVGGNNQLLFRLA